MVLQSRVKFTNSHLSAPSKMTSSPEIDITPKRLKIPKFRKQILVDNLKSYSNPTFLEIEKKMSELWCSKVGSNSNSKIVCVRPKSCILQML